MLDFYYGHQSLVLIFGLLFGGTPALLGFIYLMLNGYMKFTTLIAYTVFCTLAWDIAWYIIGRFIVDKVRKYRFLGRLSVAVDHGKEVHKRHSFKILFISRFVYGTNNIIEILCGTYKLNFSYFLLANLGSIILWFSILAGIGLVLDLSLDSFTNITENISIAGLIFFAVMIIFYIFIKRSMVGKFKKLEK